MLRAKRLLSFILFRFRVTDCFKGVENNLKSPNGWMQ